jgi:hypothetical protein
MVDNAAAWLYTDRDACCERYFPYKINSCKGSSNAVATGKYFPDWEGNNVGCLKDQTSTPAPAYMAGNGLFLFDTIDECCAQHFGYREAECKGSASSAGTNKWWIDWTANTCMKDCATGPDCKLAEFYGKNNLHTNKESCCRTHMPYEYRNCI